MSLNGVRRVLYGVPEIKKAVSVVVNDGEKDTETARGLGLTATPTVLGNGGLNMPRVWGGTGGYHRRFRCASAGQRARDCTVLGRHR